MNVFAAVGRVVAGPVPHRTPDAEWSEFTLEVDQIPWLQLTLRVTATTVACGGEPVVGSRVNVVATLGRDDWVVRAGTRATCWSAEASLVSVLDAP